jgi:hypothetical protein
MMAQRLYTDRKWVDPVVFKITNAEPALMPPVVVTGKGTRHADAAGATLRAELRELGKAAAVEVGFQYRRKKGVEELYTPDDEWKDTPLVRHTAAGEYHAELRGLRPDESYEFRAVAKHPLLTVHGEDAVLATPGP